MTLAEAVVVDDLPRNEPVVALRRVFLWLNSGCNARCIMCDIWKDRSGSRLTVADIENWSREWTSMRTAVLCGEALLHPELWPICRVLRERGLRIELLSNGFLVGARAVEIVSHCDELRVSLDGPAFIHNVTRGNEHAYELLGKGVRAVKTLAASYPIHARCAVSRRNYRWLPETVAAAKELGLDGISFSGTDVYNEEAFKRYGHIDSSYTSGFAFGAEELDALQKELDRFYRECADDFASGYISDTVGDVQRNIGDYYRGLAGAGPLPVPYCNSPWTSAVIEHDGTVRPCFPLDSYGSLRETDSLFTLLNDEAARAMRAALDVRTNPKCLHCVCPTATPRV